MMKKIVLSLALLVSAGRASALDWTARDTAVELAYTGLCVVDLLQTSKTAGPRARSEELNPILGKNPSHSEVNALLGGSLALHWIIALALPRPYREVFQGITGAVKVGLVTHNLVAGGLTFTTPW